MILPDARLAVRNAGADIPTAKFDVANANLAAAGEMLKQLFAADAIGGDVERAGAAAREAFSGGVPASWRDRRDRDRR